MKNKIASLIITCSLVMGACVPAFASSVTPSNFTPYLQSNSGYYWINPNNGYNSTVSSGTKLVDMIGQLGGNLTQGIYNILSKLSNTGRIYLYNYSGTNTSYNAGTSLGDLVGYGLQNLTQTNSFIYDKIDDLLTSVNSIKGYVDGVEGYIDGVETGLTNINTNLTGIKGYVDGVEGYIDGLEQGQADIVDAVEGISIPTTDLTTVHSYLNNIASDVELNEINTSGIDDTLDYIADKMFLSSSGTLADDIENILYSNRDILNGLGYSYGDTLKDGINGVVNVGSDIVSNVSNLYSVNSTISAISSDIRSIATSQMAIQSNISDINDGIHSDTTDLNAKLQTLTDNYNNIDWVEIPNCYLGCSTSYPGDYISGSTFGKDFYFRFNNPSGKNTFRVVLPLMIYAASSTRANIDVEAFYGFNGQYIYHVEDYSFYTIGNYNYMIVTLTTPVVRSGGLVVHVHSDLDLNAHRNSTDGSLYYLDNSSRDYLDVNNSLIFNNINRLFEQAKFMFFDDDTIALKKQEKSKNDTALGTITGSGSASASGDDFSGVGDSVSSVKNGINTGTNVSNILGVFNNSDGYSWFSSEIASDIDQTSNFSNRLLRSNSDPDTPLINQRLNELYSVMGVDHD